MTISIIIATFNRGALLGECLEYVSRQHFEPGDEVIVVDNGSTDHTAAVIVEAQARCPVPLHHLVERTPGKSHAIARALDVAAGDVLALTDDDVDVDGSWLEAIRAAMADGDTALVGGPVTPRWEHKAPAWLRATASGYGRMAAPLGLVDYGPDRIELGARTVLGANLAVRRSVFLRAGGFVTGLGKLRGTLLSGEDHELCRRVQAAGLRAVYDPRVRVTHWVPAERMRVGYYVSWFFWSGITNAALDMDEPVRSRCLLGVPLYLIKRAAIAACGAVASALVGNVTAAVEQLIDVAFAAGYASRRWRLPQVRPATPLIGPQR